MISDCGSLERVGAVGGRHAALFARVPTVVIDHHASNDSDGAADWIDPRAAATCEMVALLALRLGVPLDVDEGALATALMAGIVMDTATFAHPNATPRTLAVSAALVHAGAPLSDISRRLYRTKPDVQLRLFGRVLDRLATSADGRIVWSTLTDADLASTGTTPAHSEGIIDLLAQAETAEVAILFKEDQRGTRLSVRTRPGGVDATVLTGGSGAAGTRARPARRSSRPSTRPDRWSLPRPSGSSTRSGADDGPRIARARARRHPRRREARRPHLARRGRARPAAGGHQARRARRHAGPVRVGRPADLPRPRDPRRRVPPRRPQGLPRDRLLRRVVDHGRPRGGADAGGGAAPTARRSKPRWAIRGTILQRPPAFSALKVGWPACLRARPRRGDGRARGARGDDPLDRISSRDDSDPDRPVAVIDVVCSAGTYVRALARDLGETEGPAPTSARSSAPVRDPSGWRRRSRDEIRAAAADGPAGLVPLLRPIDAGLVYLPEIGLTDARGRRRSPVASS